MTQRRQHATVDSPRKPRSAGILKIVEWSEEDGCFVGSAPPLIGPACHGSDETKVYKELCQIVEEWLEILNQDGVPVPPATLAKEYSGKFHLRVGRDLHKALEVRATQANESLNGYCVRQLSDAVTMRSEVVSCGDLQISSRPRQRKRKTLKSRQRSISVERS